MSSTSSGDLDAAGASLPFSLEGDCARLLIDTTVYRLVAVQKAAYRLADRFTLVIGTPDGSRLPVTLLLPDGDAQAARQSLALFYRELCDQELRENIAEQTRDVRALILAHAFSRTDLVKGS